MPEAIQIVLVLLLTRMVCTLSAGKVRDLIFFSDLVFEHEYTILHALICFDKFICEYFQRHQMEESHLVEAKERSLQTKAKVQAFCNNHDQLKSLQRSLKDTDNFMVDADHKLAYCRHGKVGSKICLPKTCKKIAEHHTDKTCQLRTYIATHFCIF